MKKLVNVGKVDGGENKWKSFREWVDGLKANGGSPEGVYPVTHLLLPNKFPNATIVFWVEGDDVGVKRSVRPTEWNAIMRALEGVPGKPIKGFALWIEVTGEGEVNVLVDESVSSVYVPTSYGWELV